jgi:hypothetical protein
MPSTFTGNTGIEKIADGEQSGLWGDTTNLNLDIVDRALNGSVNISLSGTSHTLTTSDGVLSDGQFAVLVLTGSPSGTNTVSIAPNTAQKTYFVTNSTAQTVVFSQGSGANVSVAPGLSKIVFTNGAGVGAAVFDITNTLSMGGVAISGGTIDGTVVGGTTRAAGSFTQANFGDNDKAIFGAGGDLQIFHDGGNSIIDEIGTGDLFIRGTNINLQNRDATPNESFITCVANGAVTLSHNGANKFATSAAGVAVTGDIAVTGTVAGRDLSTDGAKLDAINQPLATTSTPTFNALNLSKVTAGFGNLEIGGSLGALIDLKAPFSDDYDARIQYTAGANLTISTVANEPIQLNHQGTTRLSTSTTGVDVTGKMTSIGATGAGGVNLVSSQNVSEAGQKLAFYGANRSQTGEEMAYVRGLLGSDNGGAGNVQTGQLSLGTSGADRIRITGIGNVGIGTASPTSKLEVADSNLDVTLKDTQAYTTTDGPAIRFQGLGPNGTNYNFGFVQGLSSGTNNAGVIALGTNSAGVSTERMRIAASGNVGIGIAAPAARLHVEDGTGAALFVGLASNIYSRASEHIWQSQSNTSEYMRITTGGNVGIGTATPNSLLEISKPNASGIGAELILKNGATGVNTEVALYLDASSADSKVRSASIRSRQKATGTQTDLGFFTADGDTPLERVTVTSSGNVGIGGTPSSWSGFVKALELDGQASDYLAFNSATSGYLYQNAYFDGTNNVRKNAGFVSAYGHVSGEHLFFTGPTGASGTAVTFNERMRINSSGNVGIGTTSPSSILHARGPGNPTFTLSGSDGAYTSVIQLTAAGAGGSVINANGGSGALVLQTNGSEAARITSGGYLVVGTVGDIGGQINARGQGRDGVVSQVSSNSNSPYLGKNAAGSNIFIVSGSGTIYAVDTTIQSTSDVRTKENIRDAEDGLETILALQPRRFDFKDGFSNGQKNVLGFVAQEIEQVFPDAVGVVPAGVHKDTPDEPYKSVGPGALIPVLVKAVQEQQVLITALTARITALEGGA